MTNKKGELYKTSKQIAEWRFCDEQQKLHILVKLIQLL